MAELHYGVTISRIGASCSCKVQCIRGSSASSSNSRGCMFSRQRNCSTSKDPSPALLLALPTTELSLHRSVCRRSDAVWLVSQVSTFSWDQRFIPKTRSSSFGENRIDGKDIRRWLLNTRAFRSLQMLLQQERKECQISVACINGGSA